MRIPDRDGERKRQRTGERARSPNSNDGRPRRSVAFIASVSRPVTAERLGRLFNRRRLTIHRGEGRGRKRRGSRPLTYCFSWTNDKGNHTLENRAISITQEGGRKQRRKVERPIQGSHNERDRRDAPNGFQNGTQCNFPTDRRI